MSIEHGLLPNDLNQANLVDFDEFDQVLVDFIERCDLWWQWVLLEVVASEREKRERT